MIRLFQLVCVCLTPMVDDEQLLSVSGHADHRSWQAEHFSLKASDGEEAEHQRAGGDRCPALTQTQRPRVLVLGQVHHPLLVGVPGGEVEALQLTGRRAWQVQTSAGIIHRMEGRRRFTWRARLCWGRPAARPPGRCRPWCGPASW